MKKITLACVMAILCAYNMAFTQSFSYNIAKINFPLYVGDYVNRLQSIGKSVNYVSDTISLNHFKDKLVIVGFWFTHCGACIARFKDEMALQKKYAKDIQLIMVTFEDAPVVKQFIKDWEQKNNTRFTLPVIVADTVLKKAFRSLHNPYYAWLFPTGRLAGLTSPELLTPAAIEAMTTELKSDRKARATFDKEAEEKKKR
ncbi:redoxin family protein [Niabella sp. CC-SYL272]|uniref:TlpA family protein disulfide reductase n=1 Tax=Niabella agricola TaxID=2891571 RepID=UPI001F2F7CE5|nr:redoxin family protein [Niabella agricola]MCF3111671.1 redoxin family protein [Niabella agricola]